MVDDPLRGGLPVDVNSLVSLQLHLYQQQSVELAVAGKRSTRLHEVDHGSRTSQVPDHRAGGEVSTQDGDLGFPPIGRAVQG